MGRITVLDPRAEPAASPLASAAEHPSEWVSPRLGRPLAGCTVGLRLDRSWRSYEAVLDVWEQMLLAEGARVVRMVVEARVADAGVRTRDDLDAWSRLVDCAVVGLGN